MSRVAQSAGADIVQRGPLSTQRHVGTCHPAVIVVSRRTRTRRHLPPGYCAPQNKQSLSITPRVRQPASATHGGYKRPDLEAGSLLCSALDCSILLVSPAEKLFRGIYDAINNIGRSHPPVSLREREPGYASPDLGNLAKEPRLPGF